MVGEGRIFEFSAGKSINAFVRAAGATHAAYEEPATHLGVAVAGLASYKRALDAAIVRAGAAGGFAVPRLRLGR